MGCTISKDSVKIAIWSIVIFKSKGGAFKYCGAVELSWPTLKKHLCMVQIQNHIMCPLKVAVRLEFCVDMLEKTKEKFSAAQCTNVSVSRLKYSYETRSVWWHKALVLFGATFFSFRGCCWCVCSKWRLPHCDFSLASNFVELRRMNTAKLRTCAAKMKTLLKLVRGCVSAVMGNSFLCWVSWAAVRATVAVTTHRWAAAALLTATLLSVSEPPAV